MYDDPPYYRMLFDARTHDLPFYEAVAASRGIPARILEYGIGSGRVAIALARAGHSVTGIDSSAAMLAELAGIVDKLPSDLRNRITVHHADAREVVLPERFDVVLCPFNGIAHHHTQGELQTFFSRVHEHLAPDGIFAFDVLIPDPKLLSGVTSSVPWFRHPRGGEVSRCTEQIEYDPLSQVLSITTTVRSMEQDAGAPEVLQLRLRQLFPEETRLLIQHHGFELVQRTELGDALAYVCRKA